MWHGEKCDMVLFALQIMFWLEMSVNETMVTAKIFQKRSRKGAPFSNTIYIDIVNLIVNLVMWFFCGEYAVCATVARELIY